MNKQTIRLAALILGYEASYSGRQRIWYFKSRINKTHKQIARKVGKNKLQFSTLLMILTNA